MQMPKKVPPREAKATEVFAGFAQDRKRSGRLPAAIGILMGVVVLGYVGLAAAVSGAVPKGATFSGVAVGGLAPQKAIEKLNTELGSKLKEPFAVKLNEKTATLDPVAAGLEPDFSVSIHDLTDFSLDPLRIMSHLTGVGAQPVKSKINHEQLKQAVSAVAPNLKTAPHEADFQCVDGQLQPVKPQEGRELKVGEASDVIAKNWWMRDKVLELPGMSSPPKTTVAQLDAAVAGPAKTLMSDPVKVNIDGKSLEIPPSQLCQVASWKLEGEKMVPQLDGVKLREFALGALSGLERDPVNARFEFVNGAPNIVASTNGTKLTPEAMATKILAGAISEENREVTVDLEQIAPDFSTEDAKNAGIKEVIGEFDTALTSDVSRTKNLRLGAQRVTGVLIQPGEEFSLEKALGPITVENGWYKSGVINNGVHTLGLGGGLSQMCVTTVNAAWFAGMDLVEFHPHSVWISRYPMGRECTLWEGTLDLKWKNPNPNPVVLNSWVDGGRLHVQIWGTKYYQVESSQSERKNVRQPGKKVNTWSGCVPSGAGSPGFTISNTRKRLLDGKEHDSKTYTFTYMPDDAIVCAKDQPAPSEKASENED